MVDLITQSMELYANPFQKHPTDTQKVFFQLLGHPLGQPSWYLNSTITVAFQVCLLSLNILFPMFISTSFLFFGQITFDWLKVKSESHSVMSDSMRPHGLYSPWNSPESPFPSPKDLSNPGIKPRLPHCRLSNKGSLHWLNIPYFAYPFISWWILGSFHFLPIMNDAVENIHEHIFDCMFYFSWIYT